MKNPLLSSTSSNRYDGSSTTTSRSRPPRAARSKLQFIADAEIIWRKHRLSILFVAFMLLAAALLFSLLPLPGEQHFKLRNISIHTVEEWVMTPDQAFVTIAITFAALIAMMRNQPPDLCMLSATLALLLCGIISEAQAFQGFSNNGVLTVGALFVVARAVDETGIVKRLMLHLLGEPSSLFVALLRLLLPVTVFSAFMNNTPIVAMLIPIVEDWSKATGHPKGKMMMPLSFASMLGGMCTMMGTSTNLVVAGLLSQHNPSVTPFGLFDLVPIGVPCALAGVLIMALTAPCLLPGHSSRNSSSNSSSSKSGSGSSGGSGVAAGAGAGGWHLTGRTYEVALVVGQPSETRPATAIAQKSETKLDVVVHGPGGLQGSRLESTGLRALSLRDDGACLVSLLRPTRQGRSRDQGQGGGRGGGSGGNHESNRRGFFSTSGYTNIPIDRSGSVSSSNGISNGSTIADGTGHAGPGAIGDSGNANANANVNGSGNANGSDGDGQRAASVSTVQLQQGDLLIVRCTAEGLASLRRKAEEVGLVLLAEVQQPLHGSLTADPAMDMEMETETEMEMEMEIRPSAAFAGTNSIADANTSAGTYGEVEVMVSPPPPLLGRRRRHRLLVEAVVAARSPLVGVACTTWAAGALIYERYGCHLLAVRDADADGDGDVGVLRWRLGEGGSHFGAGSSDAGGGGAGAGNSNGNGRTARQMRKVRRARTWSWSSSADSLISDLLAPATAPAQAPGKAPTQERKQQEREERNLPPLQRPYRSVRAGDVLLLEAFPSFLAYHKHGWSLDLPFSNTAEFVLVTGVAGSKPPRTRSAMDRVRVCVAGFGLMAMVVLSATGVLQLLTAALLFAGVLVATKTISIGEALAAVKGRTLLAIVFTFGVGTAMQNSGAAYWIASGLMRLFGRLGAVGVLFAVALVTSAVGCVVSNNATVVLMYPICVTMSTAGVPGLNLRQLLAVLMIGASSSFLTPVSYQTNLMVLAPGGYKFLDFTRFGLPLQLFMVVVSVAMATVTSSYYAD